MDDSQVLGRIDELVAEEQALYEREGHGQLEAGDVHSAVLSSKFALGWAVEAVLASHGEFHEQEKWRARRMHRTVFR